MALGFAVGTRGADHNRSGAYEVDFSEEVDRRDVGPEAAALAIETEDKAALMDSLMLCKFLRGVFDDFFGDAAEMLRLVTGWERSARGAARNRQADCDRQEAVQYSCRLDSGRGYAAGENPASTAPRRRPRPAVAERLACASQRLQHRATGGQPRDGFRMRRVSNVQSRM